MKITILGFAGSGKSTLARAISKEKNIPHLELDRLFMMNDGGKVKPNDTEERERIRAVMHKEIEEFIKQNKSWVSDGTYSKLQPIIADNADKVIYLNIPLWRRQVAHLKRVIKQEHRHPEISIWQDFYFTYDMIRRTREFNKGFDVYVSKYKNKLVILHSYKEINDWLSKNV